MSLSAGRPSRTGKQVTLADVSDKKATIRVNFDLDAETHKRLKIHCIEQGLSIKEFLVAAIKNVT